jgi:uncharacterized protein
LDSVLDVFFSIFIRLNEGAYLMRTPRYFLLLVLLVLPLLVSCRESTEDNDTLVAGPLKVAVLTGGHDFDEPTFRQLLLDLKGEDAELLDIDDFVALPEEERDAYGVVMFYGMERGEAPTDEVKKAALERLTETGQGIVILHHAILAWELWPHWDDVVGHGTRNFSYKEGIEMNIEVAGAEHPITTDLEPFMLIDEGYILKDANRVESELNDDSELLLSVDHPEAMSEVAWTRTVGESRVFCIAIGHDDRCWTNTSFQQVMKNAIDWTAGE